MKKNKKISIPIIVLIAILFIIGIVMFVMNFSYDKYSFSVVEKQWIENNKNNLIDIQVLNDMPIFGEYGNGVFYEFVDYIIEDSGLKFNIIPIKEKTEISTETLSLSTVAVNNSYLMYTDSYVLVGKEKKSYDKIEEINNIRIGVIGEELPEIKYYFIGSNIEYISYADSDQLINAYYNEEENINNIIIPLTKNYEFVLNTNNYVNFNINDLTTNFSFNINSSNDTLNIIMEKYYNKFMNSHFDNFYNEYYNDLYYETNNINSSDISKLTSKSYVVGFVKNSPYIDMENEKYYGIVVNYLNNYKNKTNVDFEYKEFETKEELLADLELGNIDLMFNTDFSNGINNYYSVISNHKEEYVILSNPTLELYVTSIKSLKNLNVLVADNSLLKDYLESNVSASVQVYNDIDHLNELQNNKSIIILDSRVYDYYKDSILSDYVVKYSSSTDLEYNFLINNIDDNKLIINSFEKYISLSNYDEIIYEKYSYDENGLNIINYVQISLIVILLIVVVILSVQTVIKKNKERITKKKDDKLKYIDMLTSLKNRNYLNSNIDIWDNNEIYPQAVVMVDLNKIKFVNDSFGINEGDKIIKKASNILIKNQLQNTDIIRTDGNEFMIYMVGYAEAQVIAYCRKLYKEMKELPHNYGASIGHSMILDNIKTIDDATNEAMIIVRENKETK